MLALRIEEIVAFLLNIVNNFDFVKKLTALTQSNF